MPMNHSNANKRHQSGASLVVALVLISVSTLVGVGVIASSNVGTTMVASDKFRVLTSQAAESAYKPVAGVDNIATLTASSSTTCISSNDSVDAKIAVNTELCPYGFGFAEGFRLGEGIPSFQMSHFSIDTESTLDGVNTKSAVFQGVQHLTLKQ